MAKIVFSKDAPDDATEVGLGGVVIEPPYETDDPVILTNANVNPFLDVEVDTEKVKPTYRDPNVDPKRDPLSAQHPRAAEALTGAAAEETEVFPTAIDAGLDQDKNKTAGDTALTTTAAAKQKDAAKGDKS